MSTSQDAVAQRLTAVGFPEFVPIFAAHGFDSMELLVDARAPFDGTCEPALRPASWAGLMCLEGSRLIGFPWLAAAVHAPLGHRMRFKRVFSQLRQQQAPPKRYY